MLALSCKAALKSTFIIATLVILGLAVSPSDVYAKKCKNEKVRFTVKIPKDHPTVYPRYLSSRVKGYTGAAAWKKIKTWSGDDTYKWETGKSYDISLTVDFAQKCNLRRALKFTYYCDYYIHVGGSYPENIPSGEPDGKPLTQWIVKTTTVVQSKKGDHDFGTITFNFKDTAYCTEIDLQNNRNH